jgi:dTDP-glucose 4,6-dehydratase
MAESKKTTGKTINIGSGRGLSIGDLADIIIKQINPNVRIIGDNQRVRPEKSEVMQLLCDNQLAVKLTGWQPKCTLEAGLAQTIEWMKNHISSYKPGFYTV